METQDLLVDSEWEASLLSLLPLLGLWRPASPRDGPLGCLSSQSHCRHTAFFPSLSSLLALAWSDISVAKAANAYSTWTNCTTIPSTHTFIQTFMSVVLVLKGTQIFKIPKCINFLL